MILKKIWHDTLKRPYRLHTSVDKGSGRSLVLLHGLNARGLDWQPLIQNIDEENWRVLALDLLGFGESPKPDWAEYDVDEHARSVVAAIKKAGLKRPVVLVGHSMGCLVASHIAARWPKLVERMILYEPPIYTDNPSFRAHLKRKKLYFKAYSRVLNPPEKFIAYTKLLGRVAATLVIPAKDTPARLAFERSLKNTILQQQAYDDLINTTIPTDIIYGRMDLVVSRNGIKAMFRENSNIRVSVIQAAHMITPRAGKFIYKLISS